MRPLDELRRIWAADSRWSLFERVVLTLLVLNADNSTQIAVRPLPWLVAQAQLSRSTLIRTLNGLERVRKVITRETKKKSRRCNEVTRYQLHLGELAHLTGNSPSETPPKRRRAPWGGPASAVAEAVSCVHLGGVCQAPDLLRPLPGTFSKTVAAPDPEPAPPPRRPVAPPRPAALIPAAQAAVVRKLDQPQNDISRAQLPALSAPRLDTAELHAIILAELRAHAVLAPLALDQHAERLAETAARTQKSPALARTAVRQLAAKVLEGKFKALLSVANGFVERVEAIDPQLVHAAESVRRSEAHKCTPPAALLALTQRAFDDRARQLAQARQDALAGKGNPPLVFVAPPAALARLAARAEQIDAAKQGQVF